ncbi:MAG: glycosyltransferase family 39 protein [Myxococcales bacterium]|nr:glycosyltransferase family 39 protein [Myxococcales bacterium]
MLRTTGKLVLAVAALALGLALLAPAAPAARGPSWEELLLPLAAGEPTREGYALASLRRGAEHDVVLVFERSSGAPARVEVHVLDRGRWSGVRETASFGVAYELPRSTAPPGDCEAVTAAVTELVAGRDGGGLGPVDAIALRTEAPAPTIARALGELPWARALGVGVCLCAITWLLAALPHGAVWVALWLGALGLALRLPHLELPFARDEDVQRLFTGHLPLGAILTGQGLGDRHPPLYFAVLHAAQVFGQSELAGRLPAALAGGLVAPLLVGAARLLGRPIAPAALAGLVTALALPLVTEGRAVSPLPLLGLLAVAASVSLARHVERPSRRTAALAVLSHALALHVSYLAPFMVLGSLLGVALARRSLRRAWRPVALGVACGAPAIGLAVVTFLRDRGARAAAHARPELAWGDRGVSETARLLAETALAALGVLLLGWLALVCVRALRDRDAAVLVPAASFVATGLGVALLAPVARVQPYYLAGVLPLAALALALGSAAGARERATRARAGALPALVLGLAVATHLVPELRGARALYEPDPDAFMPDVARRARLRPERRIATVAHYDATLLAWELAKQAELPVDWARLERVGERAFRVAGSDTVLDPLVFAHDASPDPDALALARLEAALAAEPVLVVARDVALPRLAARLRRCELVLTHGAGRLFGCAPTAP